MKNEEKERENVFDILDNWVNDTEGSIVNFLTAFSPWIAPLAPAYMTFKHMSEFLHFEGIIPLVVAALVEILGFATVSTAIDFYFFNRRTSATSKRAPLGIVIGVFIFYLVLVLVSNVVIDIANAYLDSDWQKGAVILVRALLTLQTVPGALIVAVRTGHRELIKEIKREKRESDLIKASTSRSTSETTSRTTSRSSENRPIISETTSRSTSGIGRPSVHQSSVYSYMDRIFMEENRIATFSEVVSELGLPQSTVSRLRGDWIKERNIK